MNSGEARPLTGQVKSPKLMAAQGQIAVSPLHIGTRALEHTGESLRLVMELVLSHGASRAQDATGLKQRGAKPLGKFPKRLAIADGSRLGHTIEIQRGDELGVHGEGDVRRQVELPDLFVHIPRHERDGGLHVWHHALGFLDALHAALAETFLLGHGANLIDVAVYIGDDALAVSAHPAFEIDKVVVLANAPDTCLDQLTLLGETLVLALGCIERLRGLLQTAGCCWGTP